MKNKEGTKLVQRTEFILNRTRGKSVLHLGCTNYPYTDSSVAEGTLLHAKLAEVTDELVGFDFDERGISELDKFAFGPLHHADLERLEDVALDRVFDVIVAGEMIEHLSNPGLFLRGIARFMSESTELIVTTINAYSGMRFFQYALRGRGGVAEPVHPDHVAYYSYSTLKLLIERHELNVEEFFFYDLGPEHRVHNRPILNFINDVSVGISTQLADGVIAVCRKAN